MFRTAAVATTALVMSAVAAADTSLPITFDEVTPPSVTPFGGATSSIEAGPAGGDGNALKIARDGGEDYAGAYVAISGVPNDAGPQTISTLVYSPTSGIPMVTKLEFDDDAGTGEVRANETIVEGWQMLSWTYTNLAPPNDYNRFVMLPNLGTVDTEKNYYFDNIDLVKAAFSADGAVESKSGGFKFPDGTVQMTAVTAGPSEPNMPTYAVGDRGPAGGWVFYVTTDGFHGLEAAAEDQSTGAEWGCHGTDIPGSEGAAIGTGESNTEDIIDPFHGCLSPSTPAALAAEYISPSGYYDWFLPSAIETNYMLNRLSVVIDYGLYWTSSEYDANEAYYYDRFGGGRIAKSSELKVRAVRKF